MWSIVHDFATYNLFFVTSKYFQLPINTFILLTPIIVYE